MVVHAFNPSTLDAEANESLSSWSVWLIEKVPGQPWTGPGEPLRPWEKQCLSNRKVQVRQMTDRHNTQENGWNLLQFY